MEVVFNNVSTVDLKDLNLTIRDNEITVLAGDVTKEIVADLIIGFKKMTDGNISLLGRTVNSKTDSFNYIQSKIGYVFLNPKDFLTNKTIKQEILYGLKYYNFKDSDKRFLYYSNLVGLEEKYFSQKSLEVSLAIQKKTMLASVLAIDPEILILNYIDHSLNIKEQKTLKGLLKEMKKTKMVIIVSNNSNFFLDIADRIVIFDNKKIIVDDNKDVFYTDKISKYIDIPNITKFIKKANTKKPKLMITDDIKELMKDIYRKVNEK